jgi:hypothetical protein
VLLAIGLFALVFVARLAIHGTEPITIFLVFPVALLATAFGLRAGVAAGIIALLSTVAWVELEGVSLSAVGWLGRVVPMLLLGVLIGWTTDREKAAERTKQALFEAHFRERQAAEINDSIVQNLAVAKWMMEAGQEDRGLAMLADTISTSERLVAAMLGHQPLPRAPAGSGAVRVEVPAEDRSDAVGRPARGRHDPYAGARLQRGADRHVSPSS